MDAAKKFRWTEVYDARSPKFRPVWLKRGMVVKATMTVAELSAQGPIFIVKGLSGAPRASALGWYSQRVPGSLPAFPLHVSIADTPWADGVFSTVDLFTSSPDQGLQDQIPFLTYPDGFEFDPNTTYYIRFIFSGNGNDTVSVWIYDDGAVIPPTTVVASLNGLGVPRINPNDPIEVYLGDVCYGAKPTDPNWYDRTGRLYDSYRDIRVVGFTIG